MRDNKLLDEYRRTRSDEAFAKILARYINPVFSTCLREVNDRQLAEDLTQAVFLLLARKVFTLHPNVVLSGWLFNASRLASRNALREEWRRRAREEKAARMHTETESSQWNAIDNGLNDALAALNAGDRKMHHTDWLLRPDVFSLKPSSPALRHKGIIVAMTILQRPILFILCTLMSLPLVLSRPSRADDKPAIVPYDIPHLQGIKVDGLGKEWEDRGFKVNVLSPDADPPRSRDLFDARFRLGWDDRGLLVLVDVQDATPNESSPDSALYNTDVVELYLAAGVGSPNRFQIDLAPGVDPKHSKLRQQLFDSRATPGKPLSVAAARTMIPGGYEIEARIPWSDFGHDLKLGDTLAFNLAAVDADMAGHNERRRWFPSNKSSQDSTYLYAVRLAAQPSAPQDYVAYGQYHNFRGIQVTVEASRDVGGHTVEILDGDKTVLSQGSFQGSAHLPVTLTAPLTGANQDYRQLTLRVDGNPVPFILPDILARPPTISGPTINSDGTITFRVAAQSATSVQVVSSGLAENPINLLRGASGIWTATILPVRPGFHYYRLLVDGVTVNDPETPAYFGYGRVTNGVDIPEPGLDFYDCKNVPHGDVRTVLYYSKTTDTTRRALVYTPPDYETSGIHYPVLYLQHGSGENELGWTDQGHANLILDNLIASHKAVPMIIVMDNGIAIRAGAGGDNLFPKVLLTELIPMIDGRYRTVSDARHRALAGLSLGANQALAIGLNNRDVFAWIAALSCEESHDFNIEKSFDGGFKNIQNINTDLSLLFISRGTLDYGFEYGKKMHEALDKANIKSVWLETPDESHEWQAWRKALYDLAPRLFARK